MSIIGLDLHGTIDSNSTFFAKYMKLMTEMGHQIFVVSGPPMKQIMSELEVLGIEPGTHYSAAISVVDFLQMCDVKMWQDEKGTWWCDDETWWKSKARICEHYGLSHLIDDKVEYMEAFKEITTIFILWEEVDAKPAG